MKTTTGSITAETKQLFIVAPSGEVVKTSEYSAVTYWQPDEDEEYLKFLFRSFGIGYASELEIEAEADSDNATAIRAIHLYKGSIYASSRTIVDEMGLVRKAETTGLGSNKPSSTLVTTGTVRLGNVVIAEEASLSYLNNTGVTLKVAKFTNDELVQNGISMIQNQLTSLVANPSTTIEDRRNKN